MKNPQRLKKTCDGCRAHSNGTCFLGYKINEDYHSKMYTVYSPAEYCEKPKTYSDFMFLKKMK